MFAHFQQETEKDRNLHKHGEQVEEWKPIVDPIHVKGQAFKIFANQNF